MKQYAVVVSDRKVPDSAGRKVLREVYCHGEEEAMARSHDMREIYPKARINIYKQVDFGDLGK